MPYSTSAKEGCSLSIPQQFRVPTAEASHRTAHHKNQRILKGLRKEFTMELQRYESLAQAAERTGISRKTLRRRIASSQLPVFSSGRRILRVRPEDVEAMLRPFWLG